MAELKAAPLFGPDRLQRLARGYYGADTCLPRSIRIRRRAAAAAVVVVVVAFSVAPFLAEPTVATPPRRCLATTRIHGIQVSAAIRADEGGPRSMVR